MRSSLLFFASVLIKFSLFFSKIPTLMSFAPANNEIDTQKLLENIAVQLAEQEYFWPIEIFISYLKLFPGEDSPNLNPIQHFIMDELQTAFIQESINFCQCVNEPVHSVDLNASKKKQEYITYKGLSILRMMYLSFGSTIFNQGLIKYLQLNEYQSMSPDDIWDSFQYQIDEFHVVLPANIKTIMNSWIRQNGFPIVHIEIKHNVAKLRQKRCLIGNNQCLLNKIEKSENYTWWIPLTWTSASEANFKSTSPKYWFYRNEDVLKLDIEEDEWVIFNIQNAGLYRVNYDEASWHRIIYALHFDPLDSISAINRASIISDAFDLAKAGIIPFEIALNSITYITRETDYLPIQAVLTEIEFLFKYFIGDSSNELLNKFCLALITPIYNRMSQYDKVNGLFTNQQQTNLIYWACILGHKQCVQNVLKNFEHWKRNFNISITNAEKKLMFCIAIKHNSSLSYNGPIKTILNYYTQNPHIDKSIAISSLTCIEDFDILKMTLKMLLSSPNNNLFQKKEILQLFQMIIEKSYKNVEFIFNFIITYREEVLQYFGHNTLAEILNLLFEIFNVENNLDSYNYYQTNDIDKIMEAIDSILNGNLYYKHFYKYYYPNIVKWISDNEHFILLELEKDSKNDNKNLEIIERSFKLLQSFYQENSTLDNLFTLASIKNYPYNGSYFFWKKIFNDWTYLRQRITQNDRTILEYHMLKIILPIFDKLEFEEKPNDTYEKKALKNDVIDWACRLNHSGCILKSLKLFKSWRLKPNLSFPNNNIKKTIFCTAIKYIVDDKLYFLKKYIRTKDSHSRLVYKYAIECINDVETIHHILSIITTLDNLHLEEKLSIISSISIHEQLGYQEILTYLCTTKSQELQKSKQINLLNAILKKLSSYLSTNEQITLFQECVNFYRNIKPETMVFLKSHISRAINESKEFNDYSANFLTWLKTTYTSFDYQLPKNFKPINYELFIFPNQYHYETVTYSLVKITLNVVHDSDHIVLHAVDLHIDRINVYYLNTKQFIDVLFSQLYLDGRFEIYLDSIIKAGTQILISIWYGVAIDNAGPGIYHTNKEKNLQITTQFQMFGARRAFPCFDEPSLKATFIMHILRPNDQMTISNSKINYSSPSSININWTWDTYQESDLISTYLVAFIICQCNVVYEYKNDLKYWTLCNSTLNTKSLLEVADIAIKMLSTYTEIPLPMKKIDFVEVPEFYLLGMENWGLIILDDRLESLSSNLLFSNMLHSITFKEFVIVHEIAHTWFGNLVTCETWKYIWLNEGFTRYFEWRVMNSIQPEIKWMEKFTVYIQQVAFELDSTISSLPLNNEKMNLFSPEYKHEYDNLTLIHCKAPCIVRMMGHAFGENIFCAAIKYYLKENMWKTSTPSKLWNAIDNALYKSGQKLPGVNVSVEILMESWTSQPGYPVVHVNKINKQLFFKQERFLNGKNKSKELYWIPITITRKSNSIFTNTSLFFWMGSQTMDILIPEVTDDEWIIVNIQQTGFYRVNYDEHTWKNIFKALNENNFGGIPEVSRAQILNDLFHLAQADYISYNLAFAGAQYLHNERDHLPWKVFFNVMENLYNKFDNEMVSEGLKNYISNLIIPYYNEIENFKNLNGSYENDLNVPLIFIWAGKVDFSEFVIKRIQRFKVWSQNPDIPLNQKAFSLCIALQHSSYFEWELLRNQYLKSKSKQEKLNILDSLGCSRNITTLTEYLRFAVFNNTLKTKQEVDTALASVFYVQRYSIDAILNFLIIYHDELNANSLWNKVHSLLKAISQNTYTSHQIAQLTKLIQLLENKNDNIRNKLRNDLSNIVNRKKWFDEHIPDILQSLNNVNAFN